ncbi:TNF receptor-associated factor 3-like isoform X2 [Ostrea edulis]|uniref:TNF receptor-associated factor 3-like isoform X2 n=1 Tax=Ostrea edulis TaxID=37623 RepID=UPI0024AFEC58|nr:TNF receptor-associated factor 3-like isoform X2 [Ostrea edulis]
MDVKFLSLPSRASLSSLPHQQTPPGNPEFVSLTAKYTCIICGGVLRDAVQTRCGHRMCGQCGDQLLSSCPENIKCPADDESCVLLNETEIHGDFSVRKEVRNLEVYCTLRQEGCKELLAWKDLEHHVTICDYKPSSCKYNSYGCQKIIPRKEVEYHAKDCEYRTILCEYCSRELPLNSLKKHEDIECLGIIIPCKYNCGKQPSPRVEMAVHIENECHNRPRFCKYRTIGCDFKGSEEDLKKHSQDSQDLHLQMIALRSQEVGVDAVQSRGKLQELSSTIERLSEIMMEHSKQMESFKTVAEVLKTAVKDIKLKAVSQTERLISLERKMENISDRDEFEKQHKEMLMLKERQWNTEQRVSHLEETGHMTRSGGNDSVQSKVQQHDRQLALIDTRYAEMDLKMQVMETANFNGVLMWKIRDYGRRKQDAKTGRTISLYSQPFYTGRFGYKLCARVYLNGDGVGKGTHMSLFFVVQRGEYDALLPWPFKQKVTLMLLDQEKGTRHIVDSFRPDVTSSSFKRPTMEMNIASGCPLFVSHSVLESPTYLRDDTIFIKIAVDIDDLKQH